MWCRYYIFNPNFIFFSIFESNYWLGQTRCFLTLPMPSMYITSLLGHFKLKKRDYFGFEFGKKKVLLDWVLLLIHICFLITMNYPKKNWHNLVDVNFIYFFFSRCIIICWTRDDDNQVWSWVCLYTRGIQSPTSHNRTHPSIPVCLDVGAYPETSIIWCYVNELCGICGWAVLWSVWFIWPCSQDCCSSLPVWVNAAFCTIWIEQFG